jgi:hypothetical protein
VTLTIELPAGQSDALSDQAKAERLPVEQYAGQLLKRALSQATNPSLAERIRRIWADMPDEVRAKLPADGASQHDHYVYGLPKSPQ